MPDFQADPDQMTSLASRLSSVVTCLNHEGHSGFATSALGHPDAMSALDSFVSGWSHGRSEIASGVTTIQTGLHSAGSNYRSIDQAESTAFGHEASGLGVS